MGFLNFNNLFNKYSDEYLSMIKNISFTNMDSKKKWW